MPNGPGVVLLSNVAAQVSHEDLRLLFEQCRIRVAGLQILAKGQAIAELQGDSRGDDLDLLADFAVHRLQGAKLGGMAIFVRSRGPGTAAGAGMAAMAGRGAAAAKAPLVAPRPGLGMVPPAGAVGKKTMICSYWKEGRCTRSSLCSFAHGEHELEPEARSKHVSSQPQAPPPKIVRTPPPLSSDPKFTTNRKTQICVYWKEGRCTRGVTCSFAHGEDELGRAGREATRGKRDRSSGRARSKSRGRAKNLTFTKRESLVATERLICTVIEAQAEGGEAAAAEEEEAKDAGAAPQAAAFLLSEEGLEKLSEMYGAGVKLLQDMGWRTGVGVGKNFEGKLEPVSSQALTLPSLRYGRRDRRGLGRRPARKYKDSDAGTSEPGRDSSPSRSGSRSSRKSSRSRRSSSHSRSRSRSRRRGSPRGTGADGASGAAAGGRRAGGGKTQVLRSRSSGSSRSSKSSRSSSSSSTGSSRSRRRRTRRRKRKSSKDRSGGFSSTANKAGAAAGAGGAAPAGAAAGAAGTSAADAAAAAAIAAQSAGVKEPPEIAQAKKQVLAKLTVMKNVEPKEERAKQFRLLLREWHPDKNPERLDMATAVFQFLQKGKSLLNLK